MSYPDGVRFPKKLVTGRTAFERVDSACTIAERLLGAPRGTTHVRRLKEGRREVMYATRSPEDTLNYPLEHPLKNRPRYRWEPQPDGVEFGYLLPDPAAPAA
jgi:hypothetical protein